MLEAVQTRKQSSNCLSRQIATKISSSENLTHPRESQELSPRICFHVASQIVLSSNTTFEIEEQKTSHKSSSYFPADSLFLDLHKADIIHIENILPKAKGCMLDIFSKLTCLPTIYIENTLYTSSDARTVSLPYHTRVLSMT